MKATQNPNNKPLENYKGIYFNEDGDNRYTHEETGAHFEYTNMCRRLEELGNQQRRLEYIQEITSLASMNNIDLQQISQQLNPSMINQINLNISNPINLSINQQNTHYNNINLVQQNKNESNRPNPETRKKENNINAPNSQKKKGKNKITLNFKSTQITIRDREGEKNGSNPQKEGKQGSKTHKRDLSETLKTQKSNISNSSEMVNSDSERVSMNRKFMEICGDMGASKGRNTSLDTKKRDNPFKLQEERVLKDSDKGLEKVESQEMRPRVSSAKHSSKSPVMSSSAHKGMRISKIAHNRTCSDTRDKNKVSSTKQSVNLLQHSPLPILNKSALSNKKLERKTVDTSGNW